MNALTQSAFILQIMSALLKFAVELYKRTKGDVGAAKAELSRIPDYWEGAAAKDAAIDREMAALKAQGK